jgi:hypothetical protein
MAIRLARAKRREFLGASSPRVSLADGIESTLGGTSFPSPVRFRSRKAQALRFLWLKQLRRQNERLSQIPGEIRAAGGQ